MNMPTQEQLESGQFPAVPPDAIMDKGIGFEDLTPEEKTQARFRAAVEVFEKSTGLVFAVIEKERDFQVRVNRDPNLPGEKKKIRYRGVWVLFVEPVPEDVVEPEAKMSPKRAKKKK